MRIRTLAVSSLFAIVAVVPLAGVAVADGDQDCAALLRERVQNVDPDQLREDVRSGDPAKSFPLAVQKDVKNCVQGSTGGRSSGSSGSSGSASGRSGGSGSDSSDSNGDQTLDTTQVKVVPKGSVDTGDGSAR